MKEFIAEKNGSVLSNLKPYISKSMLGKIKQNGDVFVGGKSVKMSHMVAVGESIKLQIPNRAKPQTLPFDFPLEILFEDEDIIALEKPSGMPTHSSRANAATTLENAFCNLLLQRGEDVENFTFHPITRLDSETSGVVLIGKHPISAAKLSKDMQNGKIKKQYIALASGEIKEDFTIEINMGRIAERKPQRWQKDDGKYSITNFEIMDKINGDTLLKIFPQTGRTHQIRVHLAFFGHAIVGDSLYQSGGILQGEKPSSRLMLFMHALEFENMKGDKIKVESKGIYEKYVFLRSIKMR